MCHQSPKHYFEIWHERSFSLHPAFQLREEEEELWVGLVAKRKEARGFCVNTKFPTILGLKWKSVQHESCVTFKIYNFYVVQIFTRSKDFKLFWNPPKLLFANKHNLSFEIARVALGINITFYEGKSEKQNVHFNPSQNLKFLPFAKLFYKKDFALFQNYKNTLA